MRAEGDCDVRRGARTRRVCEPLWPCALCVQDRRSRDAVCAHCGALYTPRSASVPCTRQLRVCGECGPGVHKCHFQSEKSRTPCPSPVDGRVRRSRYTRIHIVGSFYLVRAHRPSPLPPACRPVFLQRFWRPSDLAVSHAILCTIFSLWIKWHVPSSILSSEPMSPAQSLSSSFGDFGAWKVTTPDGRSMRA